MDELKTTVRSKLSAEKIAMIKLTRGMGWDTSSIAKRFDISAQSVNYHAGTFRNADPEQALADAVRALLNGVRR